jgi:hypothetical protein
MITVDRGFKPRSGHTHSYISAMGIGGVMFRVIIRRALVV